VIQCSHSVQLEIRRSTLERNSNFQTKTGQKTKPTKARGPVQRDSKEVIAERVAKLSERLEHEPAQENATEGKPKGGPALNRDRLTVGVDLGDHTMEQLLHLGAGGGDAGGGTVAANLTSSRRRGHRDSTRLGFVNLPVCEKSVRTCLKEQ
jgi:hypothetical protein